MHIHSNIFSKTFHLFGKMFGTQTQSAVSIKEAQERWLGHHIFWFHNWYALNKKIGIMKIWKNQKFKMVKLTPFDKPYFYTINLWL